jgi:HD-GYP domain-containing protein (c-di-GMP phosphodiesterase class II)
MMIDDRFQSVLSGSIYALSMMVEYRDPYTSGHQQRVASLIEILIHQAISRE